MQPPEGQLARLARWVLGHQQTVVLGAAVFAIVTALIGLPPTIDANIVGLLPDDQPQAVALRKVASESGGINTITLTFTGSDRPQMMQSLDALAVQLEALDSVSHALHQLPPDLALHLRLMAVEPTLEGVSGITTDDYAVVPGQGRGRIIVKPTESNTDPDFCERVTADVHGLIAQTDLAKDGVQHVYSAGPYVYIADGAEGVKNDLSRTAGVTVLLVLAVLMIGLRTWSAPLLVFPPISLAALGNMAGLAVIFGSLNTFTSFGTALLIGLGADFAVHLLVRYREERHGGLGVEDAIARTWDHTGPPCVFAAMTSAAGFAALALGDFKGLAHLGLSLSIGLSLCLVAVLVLLPLLIRRFYADPPAVAVSGGSASFELSPALARGALLAALALTALVGWFGWTQLEFEYDITAMNRDRMVFSDMDAETQALVRSAQPPVVVTVPDERPVWFEHARLQTAVDTGRLPHIRSVLSVATLLPEDQHFRVMALQDIKATHHPAILESWQPIQRTVADLPAEVVALVGGANRVLLLPRGDLYDMRESSAMIDELDAVVPGAASEQLAQGAVFRSMMTDTPRIVFLALCLVAFLTALDLRKPLLVVAAVGSLMLGLVWAAGAIAAVGQRLTLMNIIGFPILLGIGIDVVLHLAHRLRAEVDVGRALRTVGVAAVISTLTTIASFVSLTMASSGGIRSIGRLVVVGLLLVTSVSTVLLCLSWASRGGIKEGRASSRPDS